MQLYDKTILSLFDYTGEWSRPYAEAGANVVMMDIKHGTDIAEIDCGFLMEQVLEDYGTVDGILSAVPCTEFALSGARWWKQKDASGQTGDSVHLAYQTLRTVEFLQPDWWALENPVGRLPQLVPELQEFGPWYFQPCDFGDPYTKKTGLWGEFTAPTPLLLGEDRSVDPVEGSKMWLKYGGKSERTKELRSATPPGFARAFFECNSWRL